jgi:ubiquinone/menaquinone biosynthesis C-methylase UbiE
MYQDFAEIYDRLMDNVNYNSWADYYVRLLSIYGVREGKVCECACGTGSLTIPLYRAGFQMTGVDLSREMLWQAAQKARKQGIAIPFVQQDMKALNLHRPMDAVIATCDGVNYLLNDEELRSFLRAAWRAIRPGGALIFDVSTPHKLRDQLCSGLICEDLEQVTYFWQNIWNPRSRTVEMTLCFFVREQDGRYRRMEENQTQKAWEAQELKNMMLACGYRGVCMYGDGNLNPARETDLRWHICATRPPEE